MFITEKLISLVAPHRCMICGEEGAVVCPWCLPNLASSLPERCFNCQKASPNSQVCKQCRPKFRLKHVWVRTSYEGPPKFLAQSLKFERKQAAAVSMARLLAEILPHLPPGTIITHVPTATSRMRQRGYDHAQLVAKALAVEKGLRYLPLLVRSGQARQVGAKRSLRFSQMENAFRVTRPADLQKASIVLVDDIVTTGATLSAAARALKNSGAKTVDAAIIAQKQ